MFSPGRSASLSSRHWSRDDWWTWDLDSADPLDASATAASSSTAQHECMSVDVMSMEDTPWGAQWAAWNAECEHFPEDRRWEDRY